MQCQRINSKNTPGIDVAHHVGTSRIYYADSVLPSNKAVSYKEFGEIDYFNLETPENEVKKSFIIQMTY